MNYSAQKYFFLENSVLDQFGRILAAQRRQRCISQAELSDRSGISQGKLSRIERGEYPGLLAESLPVLAEGLGLEIKLKVAKEGILIETRTGVVEHRPENLSSPALTFGQGFTIAWQKGALCTHGDRNGATVDEILLVLIARLKEMERKDFTGVKRTKALDLLERARALLTDLSPLDEIHTL